MILEPHKFRSNATEIENFLEERIVKRSAQMKTENPIMRSNGWGKQTAFGTQQTTLAKFIANAFDINFRLFLILNYR